MTSNAVNNEFYLLRQIPHFLRARNFRLYLANGRLVDLWLNGGAAVLGHTPANLLRELKNTASRGLYAPFPHFAEGRFLKALVKLFPTYSFRLFAAPPQELITLFNNGAAELWRPFASPITIDTAHEGTEKNTKQLFIPVLPGIQSWRNGLPMGLCVVCASFEALTQLPESDILSPILLAAAARGVYDLLAAPQRAKPVFPHIEKALKKSQWQRKGIYLTLKEKPAYETWETLFHQFYNAGFLLPPTPFYPLILPGELSQGEEVKMAKLLTGYT
jgi:hypothetical protein